VATTALTVGCDKHYLTALYEVITSQTLAVVDSKAAFDCMIRLASY
jgi:hypothetical protein